MISYNLIYMYATYVKSSWIVINHSHRAIPIWGYELSWLDRTWADDVPSPHIPGRSSLCKFGSQRFKFEFRSFGVDHQDMCPWRMCACVCVDCFNALLMTISTCVQSMSTAVHPYFCFARVWLLAVSQSCPLESMRRHSTSLFTKRCPEKCC